MGSDAEAQAAIAGVHGQNFGGRDLVVNEARPMEPLCPISGGFGGGYGGGGGGGGTAVAAAAAVVVTAVAAAATKHSQQGPAPSCLPKRSLRLLFVSCRTTDRKTLATGPIPGVIMRQREWPESGLR